MRTVLAAWGPGKFDAELFLDGKAFRPDGKSAATLIPPAFGLAGVNLHTWTGWGSVTHWNAFVANLEMHGQGTFFDPRLDDAAQVPDRRARAGFGNVADDAGSDHPQARRAALLPARAARRPRRRRAASTPAAAERGKALFNGKAKCATLPRAAALHRAGLEHAHRRRRSASTTSRRTARPTSATAPTPLKGLCSPARRAASITTAASRRWSTSSITTTRSSGWA